MIHFLLKLSHTRDLVWLFIHEVSRRTILGRTALDEWSSRHRDLYLTTHNTHNKRTSMPPVGSNPRPPAGERPQTFTLDRSAAGTGVGATWTRKYALVPFFFIFRLCRPFSWAPCFIGNFFCWLVMCVAWLHFCRRIRFCFVDLTQWITKNLCVLHKTVEHNYISPSSTVGIQLHVSALYVGHLLVVI